MSFGSLSGNAIEALNRGASMAGCMQNTGEGSVSPYHRKGGDLVYQIGTAYFGCRDEEGRFSLPRLKELVAAAPIRVYGYQPGWGFASEEDRQQLVTLMRAHDEPELQTEGPPEVAEEGECGDRVEGGEPTVG